MSGETRVDQRTRNFRVVFICLAVLFAVYCTFCRLFVVLAGMARNISVVFFDFTAQNHKIPFLSIPQTTIRSKRN